MPQSPDDYNFLNDYIDKIISHSDQVDNTPVEDDNNDFFNTSSDEDQSDDDQSTDGISYNLLNDDDFGSDDNTEQTSDQPTNQDQGAGGMTPDEEDSNSFYGTGNTGSFLDELYEPGSKNYVTSLGGEKELPGIGNKISAKESQGKYTAYNPAGGGTGAVGKYQFRWNIWQDSIKKVTGVKTQQQFLHSPAAQEKYFQWYKKNYLAPEAQKLQPYNKAGLTTDQLAELVHFRGTAGAKAYLQGKVANKPEAYNSSISDYLGLPGSRQMGGAAVASSPSAQYHGLNNGSFSQMVFPMTGENTFRGLDDGSPVYLEDETGKKKDPQRETCKTIKTIKWEKRINTYYTIKLIVLKTI